ncbi:MAG: pilus assembly protein [Granulosicoccus sp.]
MFVLKLLVILWGTLASGSATGTLLNLPDQPLFVDGSKTALVQLIVERDNKLFFEAYPTYEDINGDGVLDIRYKPDEIDYYGYFESGFCYTHTGSRFQATQLAVDKKCLIDSQSWSGDFLNYVTMTRMDVMLRALYGGKRITDTPTLTVLRRAFVPWENHTWGIEYTSESVDGFRISDVSPLDQPSNGRRHLLATNNFVGKDDIPYLRIRENNNNRIWDWVDKERTQGDGNADMDIKLDVEVCRTGFLEESCREYPNGHYKPFGLLHEYGENNTMYFSLLTGSYENNLQGGVLRQTMSSFGEEEIDPYTGVFNATGGIVRTLDALQIPNDYEQSTVQRDCKWLRDRPFLNGECRAWGNPIAEMMYEGMRYLAGSEAPTPSFFTDSGMDEQLGLEAADWDNPYSTDQPYSQCSAAYQLIVSDPSPSFDGDQLPGSDFGTFTDSSLGNLHVGDIADFISSNESDLPGMKFIGESNGFADGSPSPKMVTTFRNIRGQSPEAPHRQGSYYAPSVSYFGLQNDLQPDVQGEQNVGNFVLALGSPLPSIDVDVGENKVTFAPFAKTVGGCGYPGNVATDYSPTNAIVGFVVEEKSATSGSFRVSFEDMEQGADNDMDALSRYEYQVEGDEIVFSVTSLQASGCLIQHMGYSVSGTSADGVYLVVRDADTNENSDPDFVLDVPPGNLPGFGWDDDEGLPLVSEIRFTPSNTPAAEVLKSPLWYAAKWGGFEDLNDDGIPQLEEWDNNGDDEPDNYFRVTDPSSMVQTLRNVFNAISEASADASSVGVSGGSLSTGSRIYEASFRSGRWYGELTSRAINSKGTLADNVDWNANDPLQQQIEANTRTILTHKPSTGTGIAFRWPTDPLNPSATELDLFQVEALSRDPTTDALDLKGAARLDYVRGNPVNGFRTRDKPLGDIVHSTPQLVGPPVYYYPDDWGAGMPETDNPYSIFGKQNASRQRVVYVGANDGMLHAFNAGQYTDGQWSAGDGSEVFAYIPSSVYDELPELASTNYRHKYYVNATPRIGDVIIDDEWRTVLVSGLGRGGQGVFALDVTSVGSTTEADADDIVMWEFTDEDDPDLGYTYTSPLIARMHNGRWAAIFGNGYNALEADGHQSSHGRGAIFIVDLETGELLSKMLTSAGSAAWPNGVNAPTAVDLDNDNIVDIIYTGDLAGELTKYDVRSSNPASWSRISDRMFAIYDNNGRRPVTAEVTIGSHPSGEGVMIYMASGKYLEPADQQNSSRLNRIVAMWDKNPFVDPNLLVNFNGGQFLQQRITSETAVAYDTDGDGSDDTSLRIRKSTQQAIDWETHLGWYMDFDHPSMMGEQVIVKPLLREGKLLVSTHIPTGNECTPDQLGWLMILDGASGAMLPPSIDLNRDGSFTPGEVLSGVQGITNPLASPTIVAAQHEDVILTSKDDGTGSTSTTLNASGLNGRVSWRELKP